LQLLFFFKHFIYLFIWETENEQGEGQREREGERQNPQADSKLSREPDRGLDPNPRDHDPG